MLRPIGLNMNDDAVIPAKAGIQGYKYRPFYSALDSRFRGNCGVTCEASIPQHALQHCTITRVQIENMKPRPRICGKEYWENC